jgi:hypothetical protein
MSTDQPHGTGVHPHPDTLADLQEGLLPPSPSAAVFDHLDQCESCRADFAALGAIPARLAGAAEVGAMPDELAARLDEALIGEPRTAGVTITPLASARRKRLAGDNRVLQAAAAAVLVMAAAAIGISAVANRGGNTTAGTNDSAAAGKAAREFSAGSVPVLSTGTDYSQASVAAAVPRLLAADSRTLLDSPEAGAPTRAAASTGATPAPTTTSDSAASGYSARLSEGAALSACVIALADDPETAGVEMPTPLAVDVAKFDGHPATVVVLPAPGQADRLDVFVVGPDCGPADAKLLYFARVPRP